MPKTKYTALILLLLAVTLASCGIAPARAGTTDSIVIKDPVLDGAVRFAISKGPGELTREEAESITELRFFGYNTKIIESLDGIEQLPNLQVLDIEGAGVTDIRPLAGLRHLTSLMLKGNSIADISPLKGLTDLTTLDLSSNPIEDIRPLAGLVKLTDLRLDSDKVSDLAPMRKMVLLQHLGIEHNGLTNIGAVAAMKDLRYLGISGNYGIGDFSSLRGLANMEQITVDFLNREDIGILQAYRDLAQVSFFGYNLKAADGKMDLAKYYDVMDNADRILGAVIKPGMTDYEKELAIFTYVEQNVSFGQFSDLARTHFSAYGALICKNCECQGFAFTLCLLMNKAGVGCVSLQGTDGHYWNLVRLEDGWYHVDASNSEAKEADYTYFNLNDDMALQKGRHWDSKFYPACTGTKYIYKKS